MFNEKAFLVFPRADSTVLLNARGQQQLGSQSDVFDTDRTQRSRNFNRSFLARATGQQGPLPHLVRVESSMAGGIRNSDAMAFEASARRRSW